MLPFLDEGVGQHHDPVAMMKVRHAKLAGLQFEKRASQAAKSVRSRNPAIFEEQLKEAVERVLKIHPALDDGVEREDLPRVGVGLLTGGKSRVEPAASVPGEFHSVNL